jgi:integrase
MAAKKRFTKTLLDSLQPGEGGSVTWDTEMPGLGVRVTRGKDGSINRVLFLQFRIKGPPAREIKQTLGKVQEQIRSNADIEKIRSHAAELRLDARTKGLDPRIAAKEEKAAKTKEQTFAHFAETYLADKAAKYADGGYAARRAIDRAAKMFGKKRIDAVTTEDLEVLHRDIVRNVGPAAARKSKALLSALFSHAERRGLILRSPTRLIELPSTPPRDVVLTVEEMERFWAALDVYASSGGGGTGGSGNGGPGAQDFADALRLIALTGARKTEVLSMVWSDVDLSVGLWTRAAGKNKNRKPFMAPLSPDAVVILKAIRARRESEAWAKKSDYVFASKLSASGRISCVHAPFKAVLALAGIDRDVHVHDLRATFITVALVGGMQPSLLKHLTGHSSTAVLDRVYNRLQSVDVLREGLAGVAATWKRPETSV